MNLVETRTGGRYMQGGGTWAGGESVMEVDSDYYDGGGYVVYGSGDDVVVYSSDDDDGVAACGDPDS